MSKLSLKKNTKPKEILVDKIIRSSSFISLHTYNILKTITHIIMDI